MASNLKAQLEKCVGDLDGKGDFEIISVSEAPVGEDNWLIETKLAGITHDFKVLVGVEDEGHRILMQGSFLLKEYDELEKMRYLEVINDINCEVNRVTRVMLIEEEKGMEALVRIAFAYHPYYLDEQVIDDMVGFFRMNILALLIECTGAATALNSIVERPGKLHS